MCYRAMHGDDPARAEPVTLHTSSKGNLGAVANKLLSAAQPNGPLREIHMEVSQKTAPYLLGCPHQNISLVRRFY